MSLNREELNALADIQEALQRDDSSLVDSFGSLWAGRARSVWWGCCALTIAVAVTVWLLGLVALGLIAMGLVLAAPVTAVLAAERTAELRPPDARDVVPAPSRRGPRGRSRRHSPAALL